MTHHTNFLEKEPLFAVTYNRETSHFRGFGYALRYAVWAAKQAPPKLRRKPPTITRVG